MKRYQGSKCHLLNSMEGKIWKVKAAWEWRMLGKEVRDTCIQHHFFENTDVEVL